MNVYFRYLLFSYIFFMNKCFHFTHLSLNIGIGIIVFTHLWCYFRH